MPARPPALLAAAAGVAAEGLTLTAFGIWLGVETLVADPSNEVVASGSAVYFLILGPIVLAVAVGLLALRGWSHGAAVFLQLLALPIAWYMARGGFWIGAVPTALVATAALAGLLVPATRTALGRD